MAELVPIIDHVGIAVNSLEAAIPLYVALLGQGPAGEEAIPSESVRVAFFGGGSGRVELLEPTSPDSAIARFIDRRGPGLHHICLRVSDLDATLRQAAEIGVEVISPGPRAGSAGSRVAFLHPKSTHGVLLELVELSPEVEPGG